MKRTRGEQFQTIRSLGALLPSDVLARVQNLDPSLPDLTPVKYGLAESDRLREAIERSWTVVQKHWRAFQDARAKVGDHDETGTGITNEKWLIPLFQELGYGRLGAGRAKEIDGVSYPIARFWKGEGGHEVPIHCVGFKLDLDKRSAGVAGAARLSPHGLVQQYLNKEDVSLWAFVSNGLRLRILRDNLAVSRLSLVEFDLEAMMEGEVYSDFAIFWLCCHVTSLAAERPELCRLEAWCKAGEHDGTRVLEHLKRGFEQAIRALGNGFLGHPANEELRRSLRDGEIDVQELYRQILRQVYRLLFLCVAEDRELLHPPGADEAARRLYDEHYSVRRLREIAGSIRGGKHGDLWVGLSATFAYLDRDKGCPELGLPGLGSFLWNPASTLNLNGPAPIGCPAIGHPVSLDNESLLQTIRSLAFIEDQKVLRPVDYRNLGSEELGSVYEGLLEYIPRVVLGANEGENFFVFGTAAGNERKTSGSYYTPDSLVQCLLDSALDPVIEERLAGKEGVEAEEALLSLSVLDPASGSGHFLIAAAHRLAKRLASIRTGEPEPPVETYQSALRDVIRRCIFGVDLNPMAAELCKIALWMESIEPGKPLTFLDHHIVTGNSLMGSNWRLVNEGLPADAFNPLHGDLKACCTVLKARNRSELAHSAAGQGRFIFGMDNGSGIVEKARALTVEEDATPAARRHKQELLGQLHGDPVWKRRKLACDAWTAAFVWLKDGTGLGLKCPTTADIQEMLVSYQYPQRNREQVEEIKRLADEYRFLHWPLIFPDILPWNSAEFVDAVAGGFDIILGNPPWERVKLQEEEFFASRDAEIANARNAAARKRLIENLPQDNPALAVEFARAARQAEAASNFLRESGRFPLGGVGDVNTYAVFADLCRQYVGPQGAAGILLPNGLVTGFTYRAFLKTLLDSHTLVSFYGFENEDKLFPNVHNETKFGALTISGSERPSFRPSFTAHLRQPSQISDPERRYALTAQQIEAINPNTLNLPTFRWAADAEVTAAIHAAAPILVRRFDDGTVENPWGVRFRRLFDMANDSGKFLNHEEIAPLIQERRGAMAVLNDGREVFPLYEGKMFWHFDHRYGTYGGQTKKQANKGVLPHVDDDTHNDPGFSVQPRYWVSAEETLEALGDDSDRKWFIAWRDVGPKERTFVTCVIPVSAAGHTTPLMTSSKEPQVFAALAAILSSLVVDFDVRQSSQRMTFFVVEQVAVLSPRQLMDECPWLGEMAVDWLHHRVLELVYTSLDMRGFASDLGVSGDPYRWEPERRRFLQCEIDAAVMHFYELSRAQVEWILDSFTVVRKYQERDLDEYWTRRVVLEIYDAMVEAKSSGGVYLSPLDPGPADPKCCHPV